MCRRFDEMSSRVVRMHCMRWSDVDREDFSVIHEFWDYLIVKKREIWRKECRNKHQLV